jgi:hypothetical protein
MRIWRRNSHARGHLVWTALACFWAGGIGAGMYLLARHDGSPGQTASAPEHWPSGSQITRDDQRSTLIMFAHPRCPCTRASLGELEKLVARRPDGATCWVVYFEPPNADRDWDAVDFPGTANTIPGVHLFRDVDGREARRFGAQTSGQTLLYDSGGTLRFSGGMTFARGHAGDNDGRASIESLLAGEVPHLSQTPVFGCPILASGDPQ